MNMRSYAIFNTSSVSSVLVVPISSFDTWNIIAHVASIVGLIIYF